jgi:hypothetical protein
MIQKSTIAVVIATTVLGALPATAADFRVPNQPYSGDYNEPPQEVYRPPVRYGYVPAPVYAPPAVVVAPPPYYTPYYEPYYVRPRTVYVYPRQGVYPGYGAYPRDDWRVQRPYVERRYTHYRQWDRGYRRW